MTKMTKRVAYLVYLVLPLLLLASPARATEKDDTLRVMHEPTSIAPTACEGGNGTPCEVLMYRNQLSASWVLLLYFGPDGRLSRAVKVHLGIDGLPAEQFEATEEYRAYLVRKTSQEADL